MSDSLLSSAAAASGKPVIDIGNRFDASLQYTEGSLNQSWCPQEFATQRWNSMSDGYKREVADKIRHGEFLSAQMDRTALSCAAQGKPSGPSTIFTEDRVKGVRVITTTVKAAGPGAIAVTESAFQPNDMGGDKLPNGAADPRGSAAAWMSMFGQPPEGQPLDPNLGQPREYHDFPEWLKTTKPQYTTKILMNLSVSYASWHMGEFAPFKAYTSEKFGLIKWEFNPGIANRVAFEAPVHILAHQQSIETQSAVRWGIGIHMELGFWNTDLGRFIYARQLDQIANTVYLTMVLNAEYRLFHAGGTADSLEALLRMPISEKEFRNNLLQEDLEFDACHKRQGLQVLISRARKVFQSRGLNPDQMHMVIPESAWESYIAAFPENKQSLTGVAAIHKTRPIRTERHAEREASRSNITHGTFNFCSPADQYTYAGMATNDSFHTGMAVYGRYFDSANLYRDTSQQTLFRRMGWYDYRRLNRGNGDPRPPDFPEGEEWNPATDGYPATPEIGFRILCAPWLAELKDDAVLDTYFSNANKAGYADRAAGAARRPTGQDYPTAREFYDRHGVDMKKLEALIDKRVTQNKLAGITRDALLDLRLNTSRFFDLCFSADIPVHIPIIDAAPHQARQTQTVAFFIKGGANTYIGFPMAMFGKDPIIATATLSLWWFSSCVAYDDHIITYHAACVCGYDRGNDETFWDYGDAVAYNEFRNAMSDPSRASAMDRFASRFAFGCLPNYKGPQSGTIDITGAFDGYYTKGGPKSAGTPELHFDTALVYKGYWGFKACVRKQWLSKNPIDLGSPIDNTICSLASSTIPAMDLAGFKTGKFIEGTSLMRHVDFPNAGHIRNGVPQPLVTGFEIFLRNMIHGASSVPWTQM